MGSRTKNSFKKFKAFVEESLDSNTEVDKLKVEMESLKIQLFEKNVLLNHITTQLQRRQPAGSPPPGGLPILTEWILNSLVDTINEQEKTIKELQIKCAAWEMAYNIKEEQYKNSLNEMDQKVRSLTFFDAGDTKE